MNKKSLDVSPNTVEENTAENFLDIDIGNNNFVERNSKTQETKVKMDKGDYKIKQPLRTKKNGKHSEETTHGLGENICNLCI